MNIQKTPLIAASLLATVLAAPAYASDPSDGQSSSHLKENAAHPAAPEEEEAEEPTAETAPANSHEDSSSPVDSNPKVERTDGDASSCETSEESEDDDSASKDESEVEDQQPLKAKLVSGFTVAAAGPGSLRLPLAASDSVGTETKTVLRAMTPGEERRYAVGVVTLVTGGALASASVASAILSFGYANRMKELQETAGPCPGSLDCIELDVKANSRANTARLSLGLGLAAAATITAGTLLLISVPNKHTKIEVGARSVHVTGSF